MDDNSARLIRIKEVTCLSEQDKLNEFMNKHTYTQYMITEDYHNVEMELIIENDLPLNIQGNSHVFVSTNKERRDLIYSKYYSMYVNSPLVKKVVSTKFSDEELLIYAIKAKKEGIQNKSQFVKWFRIDKNKSASQKRLYTAWIKAINY